MSRRSEVKGHQAFGGGQLWRTWKKANFPKAKPTLEKKAKKEKPKLLKSPV